MGSAPSHQDSTQNTPKQKRNSKKTNNQSTGKSYSNCNKSTQEGETKSNNTDYYCDRSISALPNNINGAGNNHNIAIIGNMSSLPAASDSFQASPSNSYFNYKQFFSPVHNSQQQLHLSSQSSNSKNGMGGSGIKISKDSIKICILGVHTAVGKSTLLRNFIEQEVILQEHNPTLGIEFTTTKFFVAPHLQVDFHLFEIQNSEQVWNKIPQADVYFLVFDEFDKQGGKEHEIKEKIQFLQQNSHKKNQKATNIILVGNDKLDMKITGKETILKSDFMKDVQTIQIINFNFMKEVNDLFTTAYFLKYNQKRSQVQNQSQDIAFQKSASSEHIFQSQSCDQEQQFKINLKNCSNSSTNNKSCNGEYYSQNIEFDQPLNQLRQNQDSLKQPQIQL